MTLSPPTLFLVFDDRDAAQRLAQRASSLFEVRHLTAREAIDAASPQAVLCDSAAANAGWLRAYESLHATPARLACFDARDASLADDFMARTGAELVVPTQASDFDLHLTLRAALSMHALKAQRDEAERLKHAFIEVASHELRSPLTVMLGLAHLAMKSPDASAMMIEKIQRIYAAGERLARLDDELVAMLAAGHPTLLRQATTLPLAPLIEASVESLRPFVERRRQRLVLDLADDLGALTTDAVRLRDSLDHLLMNAVKFTPDGGEITVRASRRADRAVSIAVRDSGIGIAPGAVSHVFDLFFTEVDVSRHSSGRYEFCRRGVGLGLSVVRAFARSSGGEVTVESAEGSGSTFTLTLPDGAPDDARCLRAETA